MLFRAKAYPIDSSKLACLVCGFGAKILSYTKAIEALNAAGYSVIAYEYDENVLSDGDLLLLPQLIAEITADFEQKSHAYKEALATGVSLGAYIAFNVQRRNQKIKRGLYGTAGISVAHALFTVKVFRRPRKKFESNGFTEKSLMSAWKEIEILEDLELNNDKSLLIVMGKLDKIVRYKTAAQMMDSWKRQGIKVEYISKKWLGHAMTIRWYKNNLGLLLRKYDTHIG